MLGGGDLSRDCDKELHLAGAECSAGLQNERNQY
jgi:hypothetical protein